MFLVALVVLFPRAASKARVVETARLTTLSASLATMASFAGHVMSVCTSMITVLANASLV